MTALDLDPACSAGCAAAPAGCVWRPSAPTRGRSSSARGDFALCLVPMQTIQLLGGSAERAAFLRAPAPTCAPGGLLACAIVDRAASRSTARPACRPFAESAHVGERCTSASRPACASSRRVVHRASGGSLPRASRGAHAAVLRRDRARPAQPRQLEREGARAGLHPSPHRAIAPTEEHVGSDGGDAACLSAASPQRAVLRVCALYPDLMNIYADRGNLLVLEHRCAWRGIGFELSSSGLGEELDADAHELYYIGGGQDRDQRLCAEDLIETKREALHAAAARGAVVLGVCGGYQLLGTPTRSGRRRSRASACSTCSTVREDGPRLIGNVAIEVVARRRADAAARARGLREPRRANPSRRRPASPRTRAQGPRQRRAQRLRGRAQRRHDRHLSARPAAAQEHVVRGLADRARSAHRAVASSRRSTTRSSAPPTQRAPRAGWPAVLARAADATRAGGRRRALGSLRWSYPSTSASRVAPRVSARGVARLPRARPRR